MKKEIETATARSEVSDSRMAEDDINLKPRTRNQINSRKKEQLEDVMLVRQTELIAAAAWGCVSGSNARYFFFFF